MDRERLKQLASEKAVEEVRSGMIVGLGTGSTVYYALLKLGERVRDGLDIVGISTSAATEEIAAAQGIPLSTLEKHPVIDLTIDGADEVDANLDLIKGGGGALVREKIIAYASKRLIIVVDEGKLSEHLATNFYLPVEVVQFGWQATQRVLNEICGKSILRYADGALFLSDNGNYILDCHFDGIPHPGETELQLNNIPGSVENGLFVNRADKVVIGTTSGVQTKEK